MMFDLLNQKEKSFKSSMYKVVDKESRIVNVQLQSKGMQKLLKDDKADYFIVPWVRINSADLTSIGHEIMGNVANQIAHPERR